MGIIRNRVVICTLPATTLLLGLWGGELRAEEELPLLESRALGKPATIVIDKPIQSQRQILGNRARSSRQLPPRTRRVAQKRVRPPAPVVKSCAGEEFNKLHKTTAAGIGKAWQDTEAGRWGYGFRSREEHGKWQTAHKTLFAETGEACKAAVSCNRRHGAKASRRCNNLNWQYAGWLQTSREFAAKVQQMETGQAPSLCSLSPDAADLGDCFDRLAERISEDCSGPECGALSSCWRSVSYLDEAIRQAESACRFSGQQISQCRGWQDASARRQKTFNRCETMYRNAGLNIQPVL